MFQDHLTRCVSNNIAHILSTIIESIVASLIPFGQNFQCSQEKQNIG